jgi:hypothetical protein
LAIFKRSALAVVVLTVAGNSLPQAQTVSCTCRYNGENYGLGESICLSSPEGLRMATCEMVLNNTSWQFSDAPCPVTELQTEDGTAAQRRGSQSVNQTPWQNAAIPSSAI